MERSAKAKPVIWLCRFTHQRSNVDQSHAVYGEVSSHPSNGSGKRRIGLVFRERIDGARCGFGQRFAAWDSSPASAPRGPRMKCSWDCGEQLTGCNMRAHFTTCPKRPPGCSNPGSNHSHHRRRSPKVKRGRPPGLRMKCGWARGAQLTGHRDALRTSPYARSDRQPPPTWTAEGGTREPSADAHRGGECSAVGAAARDSRQTSGGGCAAVRRESVDCLARTKRPHRWYSDRNPVVAPTRARAFGWRSLLGGSSQ
jgi:hypothetical protein